MGTSSEEGESFFVRGSSWRITRRYKSPAPPAKPPRPSLQAKQQDRPPLPPPRHSEDPPCKTSLDVASRASLRYGGADRASPFRSLPPHPILKSHSFHDETRVRQLTREILPLAPRTSTFYQPIPDSTDSSNHITNEDLHGQYLPAQDHRDTKPLPPRRANSLIPIQSPSSPGVESKKSVFSFLKSRRATSSSPRRGGSLRGDEFRGLESERPEKTNIPQIGKVESRSSSPSPHRPAAVASPTTYRRVRHTSDNSLTPSPSTFRRAGSMPLQRVYAKRKVSMDVATTINRLMSQSMRLPHTSSSSGNSTQNQDQCSDRGTTSPWGEGAFMQWPLRPYQERNTQQPLQPPSTYAPSIHPASHHTSFTHASTHSHSHHAPSTQTTSIHPLPYNDPSGHTPYTHAHSHQAPNLHTSSTSPPPLTHTPSLQSQHPNIPSTNPNPMYTSSSPSTSLPDRGNHSHTHQPSLSNTNAASQLQDESDNELAGSRVCLLPRPTPENSQAARPKLLLKGCHENTGFLDYPKVSPSSSTSSTSSNSSSPSSPSVAYPTKTYIRPTPMPDTKDGEDTVTSQGCGNIDISSSGQGQQARLTVSPRNSVLSAGGSESPRTVSRSFSLISTDSGVGSMWGLSSTVDLVESLPPTDNFSYLIANDREYLDSLVSLLSDYSAMSKTTPPSIRQHFDLVFQQIELITHFQEMLHENLKSTGGDVSCLAKVLRDDQFQCYSSYMVLTPAVQRDFQRHSSYFQEHFPDLLRNILKPSFRLNFYAMILDSFKKERTDNERKEVESTVEYLNKLKREANTEMTLTAVMESPVDLRLGGDLLHIGDLYCMSAASLQKKKYTLILFENLLVITSCKQAFYKYKIHYRVEQLEKVKAVGQNELLLHVLTQGQTQHTTLRFRARAQNTRDQWVERLQKITEQNQQAGRKRRQPDSGNGFGSHSRLLPLSLAKVYPNLSNTLELHKTPESIAEVPIVGDFRSQLLDEERNYLTSLSKLLNPETLVPHPGIAQLLDRLYELHSKGILPTLERSRNVNEILKWFLMNGHLFDIYTEYLVTRSLATLQINTPTATHYISPVQHFTFYLAWFQQLTCSPTHSSAAKEIIHRFFDFTKQAQNQLVSQVIIGRRIDFHRSGDFVRYDKMDVKTRKKEVRGGTYFALLFQNVIILTKPRAPYYEYAWDIWLDQVNLGPPVALDSAFKLEVRQGGGREPVTYEFGADHPTIKQEWLNCLHQQMLQQAEKIRKRTSIHSHPHLPQQSTTGSWEHD